MHHLCTMPCRWAGYNEPGPNQARWRASPAAPRRAAAPIRSVCRLGQELRRETQPRAFDTGAAGRPGFGQRETSRSKETDRFRPSLALSSALGREVRNILPSQVQNELETQVSGTGDLLVV